MIKRNETIVIITVLVLLLLATAFALSAGIPLVLELPTESPIEIASGRSEPTCQIPSQYAAIMANACEQYGVPVWLMARLIQRESSWDPMAINDNGDSRDMGICQFNSTWIHVYFEAYGKFDPFVPEEAIPVAVQHIVYLYERTGSWGMAVAAYNCGLGRVLSGDVPESTWDHFDAIMGGL